MLKEERHNIILSEIKTHNKVYSTELGKLLGVSEDTVRRDLNELAKSGHIKKVHGGAMANPFIPAVIKNQHITKQQERVMIAEKASEYLQPHSVILLDGVATNLIMVDMLPKDLTATIFTNSLQIASKLFEFPYIETILLGGRLSHKYRMTTGMDVINSLLEIHADICFMEVSSVHEEIGVTESDREIAITKKAMIKASSRVVVLCLSENIGSIQPFKVESINKIDALISDFHPDHFQLEKLRTKGVEII